MLTMFYILREKISLIKFRLPKLDSISQERPIFLVFVFAKYLQVSFFAS